MQFEILLDDMVRIALEQNPHLVGLNLRFVAEQGRVTLQGTVASYYQKQMAQEALRDVYGIADISNQLEVVAPT